MHNVVPALFQCEKRLLQYKVANYIKVCLIIKTTECDLLLLLLLLLAELFVFVTKAEKICMK